MRADIENFEMEYLSPYAAKSALSKGRLIPMEKCDLRSEFQRDRDRILHSKTFRRLKHKTQVFLSPTGDHYRTRLTHTLEVSQVARTIARALRLNEDLVEAISLGHDLGHTPFGHAGERTLNSLMQAGFEHNKQSLRVVDVLEKLNLTYEVRDGILCHTGSRQAETLEGQIVRYADRIAYINHDIDDAIRAGILSEGDIPKHISEVLGDTHGKRIDSLVRAVISGSGDGEIKMPPAIQTIMDELRQFMFDNIYNSHSLAKKEENKAERIVEMLFGYYIKHTDEIPHYTAEEGEQAVGDYIAGMTDVYAINEFKRIFLPDAWNKY